MCFGCSKEPPHRDGSFEYPQHLFWLRNNKNNYELRTLVWVTDSGIRALTYITELDVTRQTASSFQVMIKRSEGCVSKLFGVYISKSDPNIPVNFRLFVASTQLTACYVYPLLNVSH